MVCSSATPNLPKNLQQFSVPLLHSVWPCSEPCYQEASSRMQLTGVENLSVLSTAWICVLPNEAYSTINNSERERVLLNVFISIAAEIKKTIWYILHTIISFSFKQSHCIYRVTQNSVDPQRQSNQTRTQRQGLDEDRPRFSIHTWPQVSRKNIK